MKIKDIKVLDMIGFIVFKLILDNTYVNFIHPIFNYSGMYLDFNKSKYIESWLIYLIISVILFLKKDSVIYLLLLMLNFILIVPTTTLYAYQNRESIYFYMMIIPYIGFILLSNCNEFKLKYIKNGRLIAVLLSVFFTFIVLFNYLKIIGVRNINFNFSDVYILRAKYGGAINHGIFGYLNGWVTKVSNIFLICWSLKKKNKSIIAIFVALQILFFGLSGHKGVLFSLLIIFSIYLVEKTKHKTRIITFSFIGLIIGLLQYYRISGKIMLPSILIRRLFFIPTYLNYTYFDFFSDKPRVYWSNSIFKIFLKYPYNSNLNHLIGGYLGEPESGANTGILGSGYAHMGILGIIIYLGIILMIIAILNSLKNLPRWFINVMVSLPFLTCFISSDLLTTLLTHGFLISIILLYLYSSKKSSIRLGKIKIRL